MVFCCAGNCTKKSGDVSSTRNFLRFHKFPRDNQLRKKWLERIDRRQIDAKSLSKASVVCSDHFEDGDFNTSSFIKSTILPPDSLKGLSFLFRGLMHDNRGNMGGGACTLHIFAHQCPCPFWWSPGQIRKIVKKIFFTIPHPAKIYSWI